MTEIREFDALPEEAAYIRSEVFVREQGFAGEFDFTDGIARHLVLYETGGRPPSAATIAKTAAVTASGASPSYSRTAGGI